MKFKITLCCFLLFTIKLSGQSWQQRVSYKIDARINTALNEVEANEEIVYFNNSPDTLRYIPFHLWPNAYRNDRTAYSESELRSGDTRFYFSEEKDRGYINRLQFRVNGKPATLVDDSFHIDIARLILPQALVPGDSVTITTPFHLKLPYNFSRGGYEGKNIVLSQWYPKPAVYDKEGWHPMPYLEQGEFYSEFGSFDISITLPKNYKTGGSGNLLSRVDTDSLQTLNYYQDSIHDFAFIADPRYQEIKDTALLPSGRIVSVNILYSPTSKKAWAKAMEFSKRALKYFSEEIGEYPYSTITVAERNMEGAGGMEYPMLALVSTPESEEILDQIIAHEIGHNWFYGILASNEREHSWMDEGLTSFFENKYIQKFYRDSIQIETLIRQTLENRLTDQPIGTPSSQFNPLNYGLISYNKAASLFRFLEKKMNEIVFKERLRAYFKNWKFRHPSPDDLEVALVPDSLSLLFRDALYTRGPLVWERKKGTVIQVPFKKGFASNYYSNKEVILISPAIGVNAHDGFLGGIALSNYRLPPRPFQFLLLPMYGFKSEAVGGLARASYSILSKGLIRKTDFILNASSFTANDFTIDEKKYFFSFRKIVPALRFTFREKDPLSTVRKSLTLKSFFISEDELRSSRDSVFTPDTSIVTNYRVEPFSRNLGRVNFLYENSRTLYPYSLSVTVDGGKDFIRPELDAEFFFNYPKKGGLTIRLFAGSFFYLGEESLLQRFETERYHLNLTGPNGYEDYTYSDYFVGRNRFEGFASQQIMKRDGFFKVRTDLLSDKVGRSDEWLIAINLGTSIPDKLNPLSVLPVKIPLRLFADIGTYAAPWKEGSAEDRIVFDAGLHFPLFGEAVNIYVPLFYSSVFGDYIKSTIPDNRLLKTISFTINLNNRFIKSFNHIAEF